MKLKHLFDFKKNIILAFFQKIQKDNILLNAQGLTFNTLLTLVPLLGLILAIGKIFIPQQKIVEQIFFNIVQYLTPEATNRVMKVILELVKNLEKFPLGKLSLITYFIMGWGLLFQIEDILNKIFESSKKRKFLQKIIFFWVCITIMPSIFLLPIIFHSYIGNFFNFFVLILTALFFFLIYIHFPAKDVGKKEAFIGAMFSITLWSLSSYFYSLYVKFAVAYSKIYGSLSAIPLFLLWLFINWLVFLLGAELVAFLEHKSWKRSYINLPYPYLKLYILYILSKFFIEEKDSHIFEISEYLNVSPIFLESILQDLEKEGFIAIRENEVFFIKPLQKIKIIKVIGINDLKSIPKLPEFEKFKEKIDNLTQNFSQVTLNDLLED